MSSQIIDMVHKEVIKGELYKFMTLNARCSEHSQPCRKCAAKMTLYETGGKKNWKTIELIKKKMCRQRIHENLYQTCYEVQFLNPNILEILYPIESNQRRYEAAIQKTRAMYAGNWKKAPWAVKKAEETFVEELLKGRIIIVPEEEFNEAMKKENINFSNNNLVV